MAKTVTANALTALLHRQRDITARLGGLLFFSLKTYKAGYENRSPL